MSAGPPWPLPEAGRLEVWPKVWIDCADPGVRELAYRSALVDFRLGRRRDRPVPDAALLALWAANEAADRAREEYEKGWRGQLRAFISRFKVNGDETEQDCE